MTLTRREKEVMQLLGESTRPRGKAKAVAGILHVTEKTIDYHKQHAMRKLNIHSEYELIQKAIEHGLVRPEGQRMGEPNVA